MLLNWTCSSRYWQDLCLWTILKKLRILTISLLQDWDWRTNCSHSKRNLRKQYFPGHCFAMKWWPVDYHNARS